MWKRNASAVVLILLILSMLTSFNVMPAKAFYYYNFTVTVAPESPTTHDEVNVIVCFETASISYITNFSELSQSGNDFSIIISIYIPEIILPVLGWEAETYHLGKLPADLYSFNVDVQVWESETGFLLESNSYDKTFTVTSTPIGGYSSLIRGNTTETPLSLYSAIVAILTVSLTMIKRKTRRSTKQS